jgi:hypothetical protein
MPVQSLQTPYIIRSARVPGTTPKRFQAEGRLHYYVSIFLEAGRNASLDDVDMVVYILDPSFRNRYVVSVDRAQAFQISIWTYGFFDASAKVLLKQPKTYLDVSGSIEWPMEQSFGTSSSSSGW